MPVGAYLLPTLLICCSYDEDDLAFLAKKKEVRACMHACSVPQQLAACKQRCLLRTVLPEAGSCCCTCGAATGIAPTVLPGSMPKSMHATQPPCSQHTSAAVLQEEKALKALKEKAKTGSVGGAGLKKSGKK